jgi:hypothetical protein
MSVDYEALADRYAEEIMENDPEMAGMRRAREEEERRQQHLARSLPSERRLSFSNAHLPSGRTLADVELEILAGREGTDRAIWFTDDGPLAFNLIRDEPNRFRFLIDLWTNDHEGYERELRRRGLIR